MKLNYKRRKGKKRIQLSIKVSVKIKKYAYMVIILRF